MEQLNIVAVLFLRHLSRATDDTDTVSDVANLPFGIHAVPDTGCV